MPVRGMESAPALTAPTLYAGRGERYSFKAEPKRGIPTVAEEKADGELLQDIHDALAFDGDTNPANFNILVGRGIVTISGEVSTQKAKEHVLDVVGCVSGVRAIDEHIAVP